MTLKINTEEDKERQLKITVEVPEERVQKQMHLTARSLSKQLRIPGFRRGKVPYNVLVHRIGEQNLRMEAIEAMLEGVVEEALEDVDATPYGQPSLDNLNPEPMVLDITIPLEPTVVLGDYRSIRKEIEEVEVTDEALEEALYQIRTKHQVLEEVDRPIEEGDLVTMGGEGSVDEEDGEEIWHEHEIELPMDPERAFPGLPFVSNVTGLSAGEEKEFNFSFPDDYDDESLAGKPAKFNVKIEKVQSRELPELTNDLAQEEGEYETVEDLSAVLRVELLERARRDSRASMLDGFVDEIMTDAEIVYPPAAVELELDNMLASMKEQIERSGWQWADYLKLQGESEENLRQEWREGAVTRIERGLLLRQFVTEEQLSVEAVDIDTAVDKRLEDYEADDELREQLRKMFTEGQGLEMLSNDILLEKTYDRVEAIESGNAPDLDTIDSDEDASSEEEE